MLALRICTITGLWLAFFSISWAQKKDSTQLKTKPKEPLQITGIRVGLDIVPPIISWADPEVINYEATAEILLGNKYFLTGELGNATTKRQAENYDYTSRGFYLRLGGDYYLKAANLGKVGGMASLGFRYGLASFQQQLRYQTSNDYWGNQQTQLTDRNLRAHWLEVVGNFRASIFKNLFFGPTLRLKFRIAVSKTDLLNVQDIPGYGINNFARIQPGYQIVYQIPFRKNKPLAK
ncbi:MAG: DUF6048 family protein [Microscillaceae bacterium]|jgi:hypothetical protein|nr:DUF6048 family protein [Microscillaceae bacterium]